MDPGNLVITHMTGAIAKYTLYLASRFPDAAEPDNAWRALLAANGRPIRAG